MGLVVYSKVVDTWVACLTVFGAHRTVFGPVPPSCIKMHPLAVPIHLV